MEQYYAVNANATVILALSVAAACCILCAFVMVCIVLRLILFVDKWNYF